MFFLFFLVFIGILFFGYYSLKTIEIVEINNFNEAENIEKAQDDKQNEDNNQEYSAIEQDQFKNLSFGDLLNLNQNLKCSWEIEKQEFSQDADVENSNENISGGKEKGEIYISTNNFLQKKEIQENSQKITVNILKKDDWVYQWSSISKQGTKMTPSKAQSMEVLTLDRRLDFNCEEILDLEENMFNLPIDIKFIQF
jgi:HD superfamily phosphohydrolase